MNFEELVDVILREYESDARQLEAQSEIESLSLETILSQNGITRLSLGLDQVVATVDNLISSTLANFV